MSYQSYLSITKEYKSLFNKSQHINQLHDAISSCDIVAIKEISEKCDLSLTAAACLWCIDKYMNRPGINIGYDDTHSVAECWARLSDLTGKKENINLNRFYRWIHPTESWDSFFKRTQEFIKLCKKYKCQFSHESLYNAIALRDNTQRKCENGQRMELNSTDFFNIKTAIEFTEARKII